jgi:hypothetical protein
MDEVNKQPYFLAQVVVDDIPEELRVPHRCRHAS